MDLLNMLASMNTCNESDSGADPDEIPYDLDSEAVARFGSIETTNSTQLQDSC